MRSQGIRRLSKDRPDPVVSYSRIPAESGADASGEAERIEPRMTVIPMDRNARFEEVAAPSSIDRASAEDIEPAPVMRDAPLGDRPRRGGAPRFVLVVGVVALLVAAGVLFTTFGSIFNGNSMIAVAPPAPQTPLDVTPGAAATTETAGPGVRLIPKDTATAEAPTADIALKPTTDAAPEDAPLPNLRPDESAPQPKAATAEAVAEPPPLPAPAAAAPADDDVASLMASVDRILAERKAAGAQAQAAVPADTLDAPAMDSPSSVPLVGLMGGALSVRAPGGESPTPRPGLLIEDPDNLPVPPADIPNPSQ